MYIISGLNAVNGLNAVDNLSAVDGLHEPMVYLVVSKYRYVGVLSTRASWSTSLTPLPASYSKCVF
jgi:hypothetical protein